MPLGLLTRLRSLSELPLSNSCYRAKLQYAPVRQSIASLSTTPCMFNEDKRKKLHWPFHVAMTEEQKREKKEKIEEMREEEKPDTLFGKIKYYIKRYWYIAVPAHMVGSMAWFGGLYASVQCGVDVVGLLRALHVPAAVIEKIESVPPSASVIVITLILYKIATPLRYMTTLVLIQATFRTLQKMGKLRTAREVEFQVRTEYEKSKIKYGRKLYRFRHVGVRDVLRRRNSQVKEGLKKDSSDRSGSARKA